MTITSNHGPDLSNFPRQFVRLSMIHCDRVLMVCALGFVLISGLVANAQTVIHPAPASKVITVTVTESLRATHGQDTDVVIAQAAGFPNDTCDVITTFDVVKRYEERQTWSNVRQKINIVVDGVPYAARLRDVGYYPLGLNLACIDFESPAARSQLHVAVLPLELDPPDSSLSYDNEEIAQSDPGTPFLNQKGEVSSVLIAAPNGPLEFASANEIRMFLQAAEGISPWPTLQKRFNSLT